MNAMTFEIVKVALMAIVAGVTIYVIPLIKNRIGNEKLEYLDRWVLNAVMWAEQVLTASDGAEKKEAVMNVLKKIRDEKKIDITDEQIEILLEAAVQAIKNAPETLDELGK